MKTLSLIVPVFNEEKRLGKTFKELKRLSLPQTLQLNEIIFINDGSTDKTTKQIKYFIFRMKHAQKSRFRRIRYHLIGYKTNAGKGYAVRKGMLTAASDYALFFDADTSTSPSEIKKFHTHMKQGVPVIIGTRKAKGSSVTKHQPYLRKKLGLGFTNLANLLLGLRVSDYTCGFKAFSRHARSMLFSNSRINRWGFDAEILYLAHKRYHFSIAQVPITWAYDEQTKVHLISAVPSCLKELIKIFWLHRFIPSFSLTFKSLLPHKALKS